MDYDWLSDFEALAQHRNFSRAAAARNVTQPAFGRRIRALEEWIGAILFERTPQGARLTAAGEHFQPHARDLLNILDRARRETRVIGERNTTALTIAATHALSFTFFPGWIRRAMQAQALGAINLISDSMAACEQLMLSGEAQFLLCHVHQAVAPPFAADRFASMRIGDDVLLPLCAPNESGGARWALPGTAAEPTPFLGYSQASGLGRIIAACGGLHIGASATNLTSHLAATLATLARDGHGVAWLPLTLAAEDLDCGRLVRAGSDHLDIPVEIRLFRSPDRLNEAAEDLWTGACHHSQERR
ncbi:LysR family transcriptional regulator [Bosea sp. Leaf344]|nr:LysR family transcriptional regulator [Bosea sp. Leaf344]KQU50649.1 LysR family transcriptional regulator [Bosea sp. Leaf344]